MVCHDHEDEDPRVSRRGFLRSGLACGIIAAASPGLEGPAARPESETMHMQVDESSNLCDGIDMDGVTIRELHASMRSGTVTSSRLVAWYTQRISVLDEGDRGINAIIELNPDAVETSRELDREFREKGPRSVLHGIPLLLKDNIDTADRMSTTAGSLALLGAKPSRDATIVSRLRAAGAVILGKTNLSEWANFRSRSSISGWSGRGGQTRNPYARDRNPCGSSSGSAVAVAASFCVAAIGTETDGSIVCPAGVNGVVGLKPTVGLISRAGIIPISHTQDTAGPMTRSVEDAAVLLGILAGEDTRDQATALAGARRLSDYTSAITVDGLTGIRIGIVRNCFGFSDHVDAIMEDVMKLLKKNGALLIDPVPHPGLEKLGEAEFTVLLYEFKAGINQYLADLPADSPIRSLTDIVRFNESNHDRELRYFGQDLLILSDSKESLEDKTYKEALTAARQLSQNDGIDAMMSEHTLDVLLAPTNGPAWLTDTINGDHYLGGSSSAAAVAGYPNITVPAGSVQGLPVGVSFFGRAWSEPLLLNIAAAFERISKARRPPRFLPHITW